MKSYLSLLSLITTLALLHSCHAPHTYLLEASKEAQAIYRIMPPADLPIEAAGNAQAGFEYLIYGDYVGNGIPLEIFSKLFGQMEDTVLRRKGDNANMPYPFNVFESYYGEKVVSGNCFACHASSIDGEVILGLGDSFGAFNKNRRTATAILNWMVKRKFGKNSSAWEAYREHGKWLQVVAAATVVDNPGVNPALRIEESTLAYRNSEDLSFQPNPNFDIPKRAFGANVPALWTMQKKNALYYNGMGRGDFTKLLMQACLLGIHDSTAARVVQQNFKDVIAWIKQLKPPAYPKAINHQLAAKGKGIFEDNCSKCHGKYGKDAYFPNKIIPLDEIKTDPYYALYALQSPANEWYNKSWFSQTSPKAYSQPSYGYMASPLDGIWATAPYLHNGAVPTLSALLNSKERPTYWKMQTEDAGYDYENIGRRYIHKSSGIGKKTYNTQLPGYGNQGHTFSDSLSLDQREAILEYLKTL